MDKNRKVRGFTMAEMLIVVAIIMVLSGVAFIAVASHQRSMAQLERDTVAKEIFVAAQNHLTMAESQGYLPDEELSVDYGNTEDPVTTVTGRTNSSVYSFSVSGASNFTGGSVLDLMLPFGSIDETIRSGGSYIIRYQAKPAIVLDVFYCPKASSSSGQLNFTHDLGNNTYAQVQSFAGAGKDRKHCLDDNCVLGWYGNDAAGDSGVYIETPRIEVINKERLLVNIFDPNNSATDPDSLASLCLIVTGEKRGADETSRPQAAILLKNEANNRFKWIPENDSVEAHYEVILDDITTATGTDDDGLHFSDLNRTKNPAITLKKDASGNAIAFKPGENITVQVVAYSNSELTNIAYSVERSTNSLFADPGETPTTAMIANFRHLENLDANISNLDKSLGFTGAEQITDMIWKDEDESTSDFVNTIIEDKSVEKVNIFRVNDTTGGSDNCFLPVTPSEWVKGSGVTVDSVEPIILSYEGNGHILTGVAVNGTGDAGLFGSLITNSSVANLKLVDFSVQTSAGNAGALVGKLAQRTKLDDDKYNVSNVVAYNTGKGTDATIKTDNGNAGGLIGQIFGDEAATATDKTAKAVIQKSAAALIVSSAGGNAGGLIGTAAGGIVTGCYSGGHAIDDPNGSGAVIYSNKQFNVTATAGYAGGLIGDAGAATINNSYTTCSVAGKYAGGFVGKGDTGGSATNSYATGLVLGGDTTTKTIMGEDGQTTKETTFTEIQAQEGAFAYSFAGTATNCKFFEIVNEREEKDATGALTGGYTYLLPVPDDTTGVIKALDENAEEYNNFCGASTEWKPAKPYTGQTKLESYYGGKYNLKSIEQLAGTLKVDDNDTTEYFVATHYGDWPAPEIFVINTAS